MFCHKCGTKIPDGAEFCHKCGAKIVYSNFRSEEPTSTQNRIECPCCHSTNVIPTTETQVNTSGGGYKVGKGCCGWILLGPFGLLCGLCGTEMKSRVRTRTVWICQSCGNRFQNNRDVMAETLADIFSSSFGLLMGSLISYVGGNLLADHNIAFFGIPNWVFITLGALGGILGLLGYIAARIGLYSLETDPSISNHLSGELLTDSFAGALFILSGISLIGGIISAIGSTRLFWVPTWLYFLVGVIGIVVCIAFALMRLSEEERKKLVEKLSSRIKNFLTKL